MKWNGKPTRQTRLNGQSSLLNGMAVCTHFLPNQRPVELLGLTSGRMTQTGTERTYSARFDGGAISGCDDSNYWTMADTGQLCDPGVAAVTIQIDAYPLAADLTRHSSAGGMPVQRGFPGNDGWNVQFKDFDGTVGNAQIECVKSDQTTYNIIGNSSAPCFDTINGGPFRRITFVLNGIGTNPQMYVDGRASTTTCVDGLGAGAVTQYAIRQNSATPIVFGTAANWTTGYSFAGYISRFIFWRRALTATEIATVGSTDPKIAYSYMAAPAKSAFWEFAGLAALPTTSLYDGQVIRGSINGPHVRTTGGLAGLTYQPSIGAATGGGGVTSIPHLLSLLGLGS